MQGYTKNQPLDTDPLLSANSDYIAPSQSAVKAALDTKLGNVTDTSLTGTGVASDPFSAASMEYIRMLDPGTVQLTSANKSVLHVSLEGVAGAYILKLPDTLTLVTGRQFTIYLASAGFGYTLEIQSYTGSSYASSVYSGTSVIMQTTTSPNSWIRIVPSHETLGNVQGGTSGQHYHLSSAQVSALHAAVTLATDTGLSISGQALTMGTPGTLTGSTTDAVTGSSHTHAITGSTITAGKATVLETARTIAGVSFNGSANIAIPSTGLSDVTDITAFTPAIIGTTVAGTGTYTTQTGYYYAIGRMVYVHIRLVWTAHTGTGNLRVSGLPFTVANLGNMQLVVGFGNLTLLAVGNKVFVAAVAGTTQMAAQEVGGGAVTNLPMAGNTSGTLIINGWYIAA